MIIPDVNLLLYAHIEGFAEHERAHAWWKETLNGSSAVGLAFPVVFAFLRVGTSPRIRPSMSVERAIQIVESWLVNDHVSPLHPGPRHLTITFDLLRKLGVGGNLTSDVQLAALAIEHQAELHSNDVDFGRFPGLRWVNPIEPA